MNCWVVPSGRVGMAGVTAIETRIAGEILRVVEPLIEPTVAVTLVLPTATPEEIPWLLTVATVESAVVHVAKVLKTIVLPSL